MGIIEFVEQHVAGETLITFIISMLPIVELRGAIPYGVVNGLSIWKAAGISIIGNMIPVPFIILFIRKIFKFLRKHSKLMTRLIEKIERRANDKQELVIKYEVIGLLILVAIPLPGTGAWTGALIAALMNLRLKTAVPTIFFGVLIAGAIVSALTAITMGVAAGF